MPSVPNVTLDHVDYIPHYGFNPRIDAFQATGTDYVKDVVDEFVRGRSTVGSCGDVALDIETYGVSPDTRWSITCVTAAMHTPRGVQSVLLNPLREPEHRKIFRRIVDNADRIVFHNCFAGDTCVLTRDGVKRFEDIAGTEVQVWADGGWCTAPARCYGTAPVREVTLRADSGNVEHTFTATGNHRWETVDGNLVTTDDLAEGTLLRAAGVPALPIPDSDRYHDGVRYAYGTKVFPTDLDAQGITDFINGWLLLWNADGTPRKNVITTVATGTETEWLKTHAPSAGWIVTDVPDGNRVTLTVSDKAAWRVVSVGEPSEPVPVYCVDVTGIERFTLAEGVYTGNSPFDIPVLVAHQLLTLDDVNKVWDTLVLARMTNTIARGGRSLEELSKRHRIIPDDGVKIQQVFHASGHASSVKGFASMDINSGTYRDGAMSDTVVTLKLLPVLNELVVARHTLDLGGGMLNFGGAQSLVNDMQRMNQITLRRAARGFRIDRDFPERFHRETDKAFNDAADALIRAGLEVGRGDKLVEHLELQGALPSDWARTPGGKLSADKKAMKRLESLGHPLARAHLTIAETTKVRNYLDKVVAQAEPTGRVHPTMSVLGAAASGRMCIPTTHRIVTRRGILYHDEVRVGDETLDHTGEWTKVTDVYWYPDQETVTYTSDAVNLEATAEHRWVSRPATGGEWVVEPLNGTNQEILLVPENGFDNQLIAVIPNSAAFPPRSVFTQDMVQGAGRCDVWCVTTESGTFTAFNNVPYLTGNSLSDPELQQFPANARGIILADDEKGWASVDWSSIEPVTMGVCAGDAALLHPFYRGEDLYIPVSRAAGLIPPEVDDEAAQKHKGRKVAKVVVLAGMYGQGLRSLREGLAGALGHDVSMNEAADLRDAIQAQMPASFRYMKNIEHMARRSQSVVTISGRVLDEDTQYLYRAVNHFCVTPDTPIITADLRHVRADSVRVGDELVGFDEHSRTDLVEERSLRVAHVRAVNRVTKPCVRVSAAGRSVVCSADHLWLAAMWDVRPLMWVRADRLVPGVHRLFSVKVCSEAWDGRDMDLEHAPGVAVDSCEPVGDREVVAIETSTHTFIANGFLSHNCQGSAADILYLSTLLADKEGLSDHIHLWMHDELICDTEVMGDIVRVMQTPPDQLRHWAQIDEIVLRTDANPMGMAWKSV